MQIHAIAHGIGPAPRGSWLVHLVRYEGELIWKAGNHPDYKNINRNDLPSFSFSGDWKVSRKRMESALGSYYYDFSYIPFEESHLNEDKRN